MIIKHKGHDIEVMDNATEKDIEEAKRLHDLAMQLPEVDYSPEFRERVEDTVLLLESKPKSS